MRLAVTLVVAIVAEAVAYFLPGVKAVAIAGMALAAGAIGLAGLITYQKGWAALRRARLNMTVLMSVAVSGAFLIREWPEAAMVMALYGIAELIEARAADRARRAIPSLMALAPERADILQLDGGWMQVGSDAVAAGAVVRVRPSQRTPLDGEVVLGEVHEITDKGNINQRAVLTN